MSQGERQIADTQGKFVRAVRDGRERTEVGWTTGRILLSNKRLVLAGSGGKQTIPLSKIDDLGGRFDANQAIASISDYLSLHIGDDVILLAPTDYEEFESDFYHALLDRESFLVRHPAVAGGVVQNTEWEQAGLKIEDDAISVATTAGTFVGIELDDIGTIKTGERTVLEESRRVLEVEHSEDGTSVQTYLSGEDRLVGILESLVAKGDEETTTSLDLTETEKQVLTALYSGVSPFEVPEFIGIDVEEVEELYERLIDHDVLEEIRIRREVELNARGRSIAGDVIEEQ